MNKNLQLMTLLLLMSVIMIPVINVNAAPQGVVITSNTTDTPPVTQAGSIVTQGGTFTTLNLNATTQNPRWKAYVGNITGGLALRDSNNQTIYDWTLAVITGEVYSSRNNSIDWSNVECANRTTILAEDAIMNMTSGSQDTINRTFNETVHAQFFVGGTVIANSTCPAIATYINNTRQTPNETADFQEILLQDNNTIIYATILEQDALAYDPSRTFDFQMIVAEDEFAASPSPYYFFAELG